MIAFQIWIPHHKDNLSTPPPHQLWALRISRSNHYYFASVTNIRGQSRRCVFPITHNTRFPINDAVRLNPNCRNNLHEPQEDNGIESAKIWTKFF
jgi:hypothetical protein